MFRRKASVSNLLRAGLIWQCRTGGSLSRFIPVPFTYSCGVWAASCASVGQCRYQTGKLPSFGLEGPFRGQWLFVYSKMWGRLGFYGVSPNCFSRERCEVDSSTGQNKFFGNRSGLGKYGFCPMMRLVDFGWVACLRIVGMKLCQSLSYSLGYSPTPSGSCFSSFHGPLGITLTAYSRGFPSTRYLWRVCAEFMSFAYLYRPTLLSVRAILESSA